MQPRRGWLFLSSPNLHGTVPSFSSVATTVVPLLPLRHYGPCRPFISERQAWLPRRYRWRNGISVVVCCGEANPGHREVSKSDCFLSDYNNQFMSYRWLYAEPWMESYISKNPNGSTADFDAHWAKLDKEERKVRTDTFFIVSTSRRFRTTRRRPGQRTSRQRYARIRCFILSNSHRFRYLRRRRGDPRPRQRYVVIATF